MKRYIIAGVLSLITLTALGMWGCPEYNVWQKSLSGKAQLAEAKWNRQIKVEEAEAKLDSAQYLKQVEVVRAEGVAEANEIIGKSLQGNEVYLRYLWVQGLHDGSSEIIYVPTEANLPILEARNR